MFTIPVGEFGVFVAVDDQYSARIPKKEVYGNLTVGTRVQARVTAVKADGKLDLSVRDRIPQQMEKDADKILKKWKNRGGNRLPIKADRSGSRQSWE